VGKPPLESGREVKAGGTDFLLSPMRKAELSVLDEVLDQAVRAVETILTKGVRTAMQEFNRKVEPEQQ
jgi:PTH1 family peptidyl-tRNA hydrolase